MRPRQLSKPGHVGIGRVKFGLVLDLKCGEIRVRGQIAGRLHPLEEIEQNFGVTVSWVDEHHLRADEPKTLRGCRRDSHRVGH